MSSTIDHFAHIYNSLPEKRRNIQLSFQQACLLPEIVRSSNSMTLLELGTGVGYSTAWLGSALSAGARLISVEKNPLHYQLAQQNLSTLPFAEQIILKYGDAIQLLPELATEYKQFDFAFIDANKRCYPQYLAFCKQYLSLGGIIVADNVFQFAGQQVLASDVALPIRLRKLAAAMQDFYDTIMADPTFEILPAPTGSDFLIARRVSC